MRIETDLRMAINAAARAQKEPSYEERQKAEQDAIDKHVKKHAAPVKKARALQAKVEKLQAEIGRLNKEIVAILNPLGIEFTCRDSGPEFELPWGDKAKENFVKSGGVLPPSDKRKWSADSVLKQLAAADPKDRDTILKEYGINWT
jgi:hypothetical protein